MSLIKRGYPIKNRLQNSMQGHVCIMYMPLKKVVTVVCEIESTKPILRSK